MHDVWSTVGAAQPFQCMPLDNGSVIFAPSECGQ